MEISDWAVDFLSGAVDFLGGAVDFLGGVCGLSERGLWTF